MLELACPAPSVTVSRTSKPKLRRAGLDAVRAGVVAAEVHVEHARGCVGAAVLPEPGHGALAFTS